MGWRNGTFASVLLVATGAVLLGTGAVLRVSGADVVLWDPELSIMATVENRRGNVDYTPYEGITLTGGPASVYVRGNLIYKDGEIVGEHGSGRFIERSFVAPNIRSALV